MIEQIAYVALLSAPELASGAASVAGKMADTLVERVGNRFATGIYDGLRAKVSGDASLIGNALLGAMSRPLGGLTEELPGMAARVLSGALQTEGATLADIDELRMLRKLAADVSDGRDTGPALQELKRFYAEQPACSKK
ncbi:TPA: hypothetical protein QDB04_000261 [Burkholderia vietnamiensis]|nr:hypothetical protein [Burkholderia vietnamiensis]